MTDLFGLGWRPELAAAILTHADRLDFVEVIADDWLPATRANRQALDLLGAQLPIALHGVGLGLASAHTLAPRRCRQLADLVRATAALSWSEHLAFVRAGGVEIGHLAQPPRNADTVAGAVRNLQHVADATGTMPLVENVATLIDPPGSDLDEAAWISAILAGSGAGLLLDLHNLHANASNFGFDAVGFLDRIPMQRVRAVHIAGGRWIAEFGTRRLLDDHRHAVPDAVLRLLHEVGRRAPQPLHVALERDGRYPRIEVLLGELDAARAALAAGRRTAQEPAA